MDGSEVILAVCGSEDVGKTTFVGRCLDIPFRDVEDVVTAHIVVCGRNIAIKIVQNPEIVIRAVLAIVLFDITNMESFLKLGELIEKAHRTCPTAYIVIIGTKADLRTPKDVSTADAAAFCQAFQDGIPYYETTNNPSHGIQAVFKEILARPLINIHVLKMDAGPENQQFIHETMEWAIENGSANVLTHLTQLGYPIPEDLVMKYQEVVADYLFSEHPLRPLPEFSITRREEFCGEKVMESELDEDDEPVSIVDGRSSLLLSKMFLLAWGDISLTAFPPSFLSPHLTPVQQISYVDLSNNLLSWVPPELFQLPNIISLNLSYNQLSQIPHPEHWSPSSIHILNLSHNLIRTTDGNLTPQPQQKKPLVRDQAVYEKLWYLDFSHNNLTSCPNWVSNFISLELLNLRENKICQLPSELGLLPHLHALLITGLPLYDPPSPIPKLGTSTIMNYLRFKYVSSQPLSSMRVVVVGPQSAGKTALVAKLRGEGFANKSPTKGLEVTEWKYKGEMSVMRRRCVTFDMWDFTGDPRYRSIYPCFSCQTSVHLAVFSIEEGTSEIIRWLSDIQSLSMERVPVIVVFTHMDKLSSREEKDVVKRKRTAWLKYNLLLNEKVGTSPAFSLLSSTMSGTLKSLQSDPLGDRTSVYDPPQLAFDLQECSGDIIPLMPAMLATPQFVSCTGGEGISSLRKVIYRIGTGGFRTTLPSLQSIAMELPTIYTQIESLVRQLRTHLRSLRTDGEQKPFYTFSELKDRLRRPLKQLSVTGMDFYAALRLLHEQGLIYMYQGSDKDLDTALVAVNPQIVGFLLQRTLRAGEAHGETNALSGFLPYMHPTMIWGVEPVWSEDTPSKGMTAGQLIDFLASLDLCAPLLPGACLIPSILPLIPAPSTSLHLNELVSKRVYILGYLPSSFFHRLTSRILQALARQKILQGDASLSPSSPSAPMPRLDMPITTPSGAKLFLWQQHIILEEVDGSMLWVVVLEGGQLGPESIPFCGRVEVLVQASRVREAELLSIATTEIDQLLEKRYPSLLDSKHTPQQVEVFVPLSPEWFNSLQASLSRPASPTFLSRNSSISSPIASSPAVDSGSIKGSLHQAFNSVRTTGSLPSAGHFGSQPREFPSTSDEPELEVLPRKSSSCLALLEDTALSHFQYLVPAWECLQEAYKPLSHQLKEGTLDFQALLPDLLYANMPSSLFVPIPEAHLAGLKVLKEKGLFLRQYYSRLRLESAMGGLHSEENMGAKKMFALKECYQQAYEDMKLLRSLHCPNLISPVGINSSPPALALELAPMGSLRAELEREKRIEQPTLHKIALQVLSAVEYLEGEGIGYHCLSADNVFLWSLDPVYAKLSDSGITHKKSLCQLCAVLKTTPTASLRKSKVSRLNIIMFGLLLFEMCVRKKAYENILPFPAVVMGVYYQRLQVHIEAEMSHIEENIQKSDEEKKDALRTRACHRQCMQLVMQLCLGMGEVSITSLKARLSLCAGGNTWAPLNLTLDIECMLPSDDFSLIYWASGSRGLVVGTIEPTTGQLYSHILAQAPTPESGLFANRRGRPIPIAVGHATSIDICRATNKLWVGTENGLMGSVYVFDLPDMKTNDYIHLQDAVLTVKAINDKESEEKRCWVLVGLANGTIILFLGESQGKVLDNPLQGPRKIKLSPSKNPCLSIQLWDKSQVWCASGSVMEQYSLDSLDYLKQYQCLPPGGDREGMVRVDVIMLAAISRRGLWTVARRSTVLRFWEKEQGELKASFNVQNILKGDFNDISALIVHGHAVWIGTRSGYILLIDAPSLISHKQERSLIGMQHCGEGRVKSIVPLYPINTTVPFLRVLCSVEYPDEVSGCLMMWEYQTM